MLISTKRLFLCLGFLLFHFSSFGQTNVSGSVSGTWRKVNSPYILTGSVTVPTGQTLTIEPGVRVESPRYDRGLYISGTLLAQGTATDSVRFQGRTDLAHATASTHGGIITFYSSSTASVMEYVSVDQMGDITYGGNAIDINTGATPTIRHTTIRNSEQNDIVSWVGGVKNFGTIRATVGINGNAGNLDATMPKLGYNTSFYRLLSSISVSAGYSLTIAPGVKIESPRFERGIYVSGTLLAQGTATDSIRFQGRADIASDARSTHGGVITFSSSSTGSVMDYVSINQMGDITYGGHAININTAATPTIRNTTIANSEQYDVESWVGGAKNFANVKAIININGSAGNRDATMPKLGYNSYYRLLSSISVNDGYKLIIAPGVKIESPRFERGIYVSGTLLAQGTATDSIRFQGKPDTISDARSTHGGVISFYSSSTASVMDYVSIDRMGDITYGGHAVNIQTGSTPTIRNTVIRNSEQYDVECWVGGAKNFDNIKAIVNINGSAGNRDASMPKLGNSSFYRLLSSISVSDGYSLTIASGVKIESPRFERGIYVSGTLLAQGTETDSIRFQGVANTASDTRSTHGGVITFYPSSTASVMDYVSIDRMGDITYGGHAINIQTGSTPTIRNTVIRDSEQYDVECWVGGAKNFANIKAIVTINGNAGNRDASMAKLGYSSFYRLLSSVSVSAGYKLTINPGVRIEFPRMDRGLYISGTLLAQGTPADSIRFQGKADTTYDSRSTHGGVITFYSSSSASIIDYVSIDRLGDITYGGHAIDIQTGATPAIRNTAIRNSEQYDITMWIGGAKNFASVKAEVYINSGTGNYDAVLPKLGHSSFYRLITNVNINTDYKLIIEPGVKIEAAHYYAGLYVYGTLLAQGTATDSIRIYGKPNPAYAAQSSHGGRISFYLSSSASVMNYVSIDRMGDTYSGGDYAVYVNANCTIKNSTIQNSEQMGIYVESYYNTSISPVIQGNNFINNSTEISAYPSTCSGIQNNPNTRVTIRGGYVSNNASWPFPGTNSYYTLASSVYVEENYTLTIEPGALIDFGSEGGRLYVQGALRAIGTESAPIQLTRLQSTTAIHYGGWVYLYSSSTNSIFNYVTMDKMGNSYYGAAALQLETPNFSIANLSISNSHDRGLHYSAVGSPLITSSNFFNNKTGIYSDQGRPTFSNCNIYGNTDFGINNVSSAVADTVDARTCYWGTTSGPYHPALNLAGTGNRVSNKVKFNPWRQQPLNGQIIDLGISAILRPTTDCNFSATDSITVRIRNYGNVSQTNFPVAYRVNNGAVVTETISSSALLPGRTLDYTFRTKVNLSVIRSYTVDAYTSLPADTLPLNNAVRAVIQHLPGIAIPTNLLPTNNTTNVDVAVAFSWAAVTDAIAYDLYVWRVSDAVPTQPLAANLTQIAYTLSNNTLQYGTQYRWKVVAKRISCRAESVVQTFTTRLLPDLVVQSINVPATGTSESDMVISWRVLNQGTGATQSQGWNDLVYLSDQPVLNAGSETYYVGSKPNFSALNIGQSYQSTNLTYRVPQGVQGQYYVIVQTNSYQNLRESSYTNNQRVSGPINIALAPPPDLQVTNVLVNPLTQFSEDSVTVTYTVRNAGTGPTTATFWQDYVLLSQSETLNLTTARQLTTYYRQQPLAANGTYTITRKVKLPERISGTYYVHVITDRFAQVYEYTNENNNSRVSLALNVIQRPTPNLTVSGLTVSATAVATNQPLTVQWTTASAGAVAAQPSWQEYVYLSSDATFQDTDRLVGSLNRTSVLQSLSSINGQQAITIPGNLTEGDYYFFIKTDATNQLYEGPDETDNVSPASPLVRVRNPDLRPTSFSAPASATSEQTLTLQWRVLNDSQASVFNVSWSDQIYLSTNTTFEPGTDILLNSVPSNQLLAGGSEYNRQTTVTIPIGVSGNYHLLLVADGTNALFEKVETNNVQSAPLTITLAPWPDLVVSNIVAPATDTVGSILRIRYTTVNNGSVGLINRQWQDNIYLSPTPTVNEASLILLGSVSQNQTLSNGQSFTQAATVNLPVTLGPGRYYVVVRTDVTNTIFENTSEGNNTAVASTSTVLANLPAIDLAVTAGSILSTSVTAGSSVNVQWTVKNNSTFATIVPNWQDAIYLSANPVLDASDVLLSTVAISTPLAAGASYTRTQTVTLPVETGGILYLLVTTDKDNRHNDDRRGNNTLPLNSGSGQTVTVSIPPPADLVPKSFFGPAEGTVSQPITVTFTVRNNGTGITPSGNWSDQIYLSNDLQVGNDIYVGAFQRSGSLAPGAEYTVSGQVFLPGNVSGNYVLLLRTDGNDNVFERNGEGNNVAYANILINPQPPSDLTITQVDVPPGDQFAGANATISWKLTNSGFNAANGYLKEAVYLSSDATLDINDVLFGTVDGYLLLPSRATETRTLTKPLSNVAVGNYYVFVKTDILNNIVEQNETNNQTVAIAQLSVKVKELPLNVRTTDTLVNEVPLYYRIEIPPNLAGETLSIVLKGDSLNSAVNRLFVRKDSVPTANRYDFVANVPFRTNQELLIPSLQAGTYYLLGLGTDVVKPRQPISLLARVIPFSISSVNANRGGNTGLVTVRLIGAKFEPGMTVTLIGSATHTATAVYYTDPSKLYATFNLSGASTGQYTMQVRKTSGAIAQLPNSFTVVSGTPGGADGALQLFTCTIQNIGFDENIDVDVLAPPSVRRGQKAKITIAYENVGNVDIPAQTRILLSLEGAPLDFSTDFLQQRKELFLEFVEIDGPPGILRAGSSGFVNVYTHAIAPIALLITQ